jgi:nucleotide-binding universal stress UspA family protein
MLRRILIGLDNTESSVAALRLGVRWARRTGATLVGLALVDEPGIRAIEPASPVGGKPGIDPVYYIGYQPRLDEAKHQAQRLSDRFAGRCDLEGVEHQQLTRIGSPDEQIRDEALNCDLTLLGRGSQFRFIAGDDEADDTLKRVLKDAQHPVVAVPRTTSPDGPIVIAFDGGLEAMRALSALMTTGLCESSDGVHIISVGASVSEAVKHAEQARKLLSDHRIDADVHVVSRPESPAEVILEQVSRLKAGLLVMGAYPQPALLEFFLGSVTGTMLDACPVPLFLSH